MFVMQCELVVLLMLWAVGGTGVGPVVRSNFNLRSVSDSSLVSNPLEVPLSLLRNSDPIAHTPIIQKYYVHSFRPNQPNFDAPGLRNRMLEVDYQLLSDEDPPLGFLECKAFEEYHLLESMEFSVMLSNPSEILTVCLVQIFSDCDSIKRTGKRSLPLCINPYTKYPLPFNIYVTAAKNRDAIHAAIFFNATLHYGGQVLASRIWKKEVAFNLLPNHLKLYSFELRNCKQEHSVISIKNPENSDLYLLIAYKHKKLYMNNQPFDQKVLLGAGKTFRFMIEGRDATMNIYTSNPEQPGKKYPILYVPLYCQEHLSIEYVPIGVLSSPNLALTFPILVTSHSSAQIQIIEIQLFSSSQAVQLVKAPSHKILVQSNDKFAQVGSFVVRAAKNPALKNTVSIKIICKYANSHQNATQNTEIVRNLSYTELYDIIQVGGNRFYDVAKLKDAQYTEAEKIELFNYTLTNRLQIPIRLERILFNSQKFRMHWFKFSRSYIYPNKRKEQILLQYIGPRILPLSPVKYIAVVELSGGIFVPIETMVYDNTLTCLYQGKEDRCSKLRIISFGYQKAEERVQIQNITIKNLNPGNITFELHPFSLPNKKDLDFTVRFEAPFPFYQNAAKRRQNKTIVRLRSGHMIKMVIEVRVSRKVTADMSLLIQSPFEKFAPRLRFHFETGRLAFTPELQQIAQNDVIYHGSFNLTSTFQDSFNIKEFITSSPKFQFQYNETQEYEPLEPVIIPYSYNPYRENNFTDECCTEEFVKNHFINPIINAEESSQQKYEISVITSNEIEQKTFIKVKPLHNSLLSTPNSTLQINVMKASSGSHFCINVANSYQLPLKYSIYFLPHIVVDRPKDYFTYIKHAKRERVQTYFCIKSQGRNLGFVNPGSLKQLFRLEEKPSELLLGKDGFFSDTKPVDRMNLSNNDYLNSFTITGKDICYKFTSVLYMKLLIESDAVNDILENYPFEVTEKLLEREHEHLQDTAFTYFYDQFYTKIGLDLKKYCSVPVFPIFKFCQQIPLKMAFPLFSSDFAARKVKRYSRQYSPTRVLPENSSEQTCFMLHGYKDIDNFSFQLVIANNYSKYDDYRANVQLVEPRIKMGDIAFEQNRKINHTTFLKHYFTSLYRALYLESDNEIIRKHGIKERENIVPLYFTIQDYDEQFGIFKGERYFELVNLSPVDIHFTHYGFENKEKIRFFGGFVVEQMGVPQNTIVLKANSKSTFRMGFHVDSNFNLNITNPLFNQNINLYLYRGNHYYLHLHLVIKVAENIVVKMKTQAERHTYQAQSIHGYIFINLASLTFICAVIMQLKREEELKQSKLKLAKEQISKISNNLPQTAARGPRIEEDSNDYALKIKKYSKVLSPLSIGTKIQAEKQSKSQPYCYISEQQLALFRTLKVKEDKSMISDSQSEPQIRLSQHSQSDKLKTDEEERSQVSQSVEEVRPEHPDHEGPNFAKAQNNGQEEQQQDQEENSQLQGSEASLTESFLPDGISVCNDQIDIDDNMEFQFGFQKETKKSEDKSKKGEDEYVYYNVFSSYNPLKKDPLKKEPSKKEPLKKEPLKKEHLKKESSEPFPWMAQADKKKTHIKKHRKEE